MNFYCSVWLQTCGYRAMRKLLEELAEGCASVWAAALALSPVAAVQALGAARWPFKAGGGDKGAFGTGRSCIVNAASGAYAFTKLPDTNLYEVVTMVSDGTKKF